MTRKQVWEVFTAKHSEPDRLFSYYYAADSAAEAMNKVVNNGPVNNIKKMGGPDYEVVHVRAAGFHITTKPVWNKIYAKTSSSTLREVDVLSDFSCFSMLMVGQSLVIKIRYPEVNEARFVLARLTYGVRARKAGRDDAGKIELYWINECNLDTNPGRWQSSATYDFSEASHWMTEEDWHYYELSDELEAEALKEDYPDV